MVVKLSFLFCLYPSLLSAWCSGGIRWKAPLLSKSIDHHAFRIKPFSNYRRNSQQFDVAKLWSVNGGSQDDNDATATVVDKTAESDEPGMAKMTLQKCFSSLANEEAAGNILQFILFVTVACLMRLPSIASCTANAFRIFPHRKMLDYEPMSMMNWIVHYSTVLINYGIFRRLVQSSPDVRNTGDSRTISNMTVPPSILNRKRKIYAIVTSGLGQLFGMTLMISHSLIGTRESMAQQAVHNFSHFWMQVSAMSLGPMLIFPLSLSSVLSSLIVYFNLTGFLSFTNIPGLVLTNFSLLSVLVLPTEIFPRLFKIGHTMLSLGFIPVGILDSKLGGGTDLAHYLGAAWIATSMIIMKSSSDNVKDNAVASKEKWRGV